MSVYQGLASLANNNPNFSNQHIQNNIVNATNGWISKTRTIAYKTDISVVLTESQKTDIYDSIESQSYLNIGRYFLDLDNHTYKILNGSLGETNENDTTTATFLEHISLVDGIQGVYQSLYGVDASSGGKGIDDFFGSLRGTLDTTVKQIGSAVQFISNFSLPSQTNYETALQNFINFLDTLGDSTFFDESTFNSLLSVIENTANTFDSILSASNFESQKNILIANRSTIVEQLQKESNNLGSIRTYSQSLTSILTYQSFATNTVINDLISKSAQSTPWKDYFNNYETRFNQLNPLYNIAADSSEEDTINSALKLKNLPDVKNYLDLDSVAKKALRDTRIKTRLGDSGKTTEQIIEDSCILLGINVNGRDVYAQSKSLLENMNTFDRETVRTEISLHTQANTNS
jgi:hypothetical protein